MDALSARAATLFFPVLKACLETLCTHQIVVLEVPS
jgi:hypothetical protein